MDENSRSIYERGRGNTVMIVVGMVIVVVALVASIVYRSQQLNISPRAALTPNCSTCESAGYDYACMNRTTFAQSCAFIGDSIITNPSYTCNNCNVGTTPIGGSCTPAVIGPANGAVVLRTSTLSWAACTGASAYFVTISGNGVNYTKVVGSTNMVLNTVTLEHAKAYNWTVQSCYDGTCTSKGGTSASRSFTYSQWDYNQCAPTLTAPANGAAANSSTVLSWGGGCLVPVTEFQLNISGSGFNFDRQGTAQQYALSGVAAVLTAGRTYTWKVRACDGINCAIATPWASRTFVWSPPVTPTVPTVPTATPSPVATLRLSVNSGNANLNRVCTYTVNWSVTPPHPQSYFRINYQINTGTETQFCNDATCQSQYPNSFTRTLAIPSGASKATETWRIRNSLNTSQVLAGPTTYTCTILPTEVPNTPIATNTQPPVGTCPKRPQGDATCDGVINASDEVCWKLEYLKQAVTAVCKKASSGYSADFNSDNKVDRLDFVYWLLGWKNRG